MKTRAETKINLPAVAALLTVIGLCIYSNTFQVPFQYDEQTYIVNNRAIHDLSHFGEVARFNPRRFLTVVSFALNYHFTKLALWPFHAVNLLIHVTASFLVYLLALLLYRAPDARGAPRPPHAQAAALIAALIFLCHPLQTQAVTYIYQRSASLGTLFYLGAVYFYFKGRITNSRLGLFLCPLFAAAAFLTKEHTLTLPVTLLAGEWILGGKSKKGAVMALAMFVPLFIIYYAVFIHSRVSSAGLDTVTRLDEGMPRLAYMITEINVLCTYLRLLIFPMGQNLAYDYPVSFTLFTPGTLFSAVLLGALAFLGYRLRKGTPLITFGIAWFFITLSMESGIFAMTDVIFEHRMYLPMFGFALAVPVAAERWLANNRVRYAVCAAAILALAATTFARNHVWRTKVSLWEDVVKKSPKKPLGYNNLAQAYSEDGNFKEALAYAAAGAQLDPTEPVLQNNIALIFFQKGDFGTAQEYFLRAIELGLENADTYYKLAKTYAAAKDAENEHHYLQKAVETEPANAELWAKLAFFYVQAKDYEAAVTAYGRALELEPNSPDTLGNLGAVLTVLGRYEQAHAIYVQAVRLAPRSPKNLNGLGAVQLKLGLHDEAIVTLKQALALNPDYSFALTNLVRAYTEKNDPVNADRYAKELEKLR